MNPLLFLLLLLSTAVLGSPVPTTSDLSTHSDAGLPDVPSVVTENDNKPPINVDLLPATTPVADISELPFPAEEETTRLTAAEILKATDDELNDLKPFKFYNAHLQFDELMIKKLQYRFPNHDQIIRDAVEQTRKEDILNIGSGFVYWKDLLAEKMFPFVAEDSMTFDDLVGEIAAQRWWTQDEMDKSQSRSSPEGLEHHDDDWRMDELISSILINGFAVDAYAFNAQMRNEYLHYVQDQSRTNLSDLLAFPSLLKRFPFFTRPMVKPGDDLTRMLELRKLMRRVRLTIQEEKSKHHGLALKPYDDDSRMAVLLARFLYGDVNEVKNVVNVARKINTFQLAVTYGKMLAARSVVESANTDMDPFFLAVYRNAIYTDDQDVKELLMEHRPSLSDKFHALEKESEESDSDEESNFLGSDSDDSDDEEESDNDEDEDKRDGDDDEESYVEEEKMNVQTAVSRRPFFRLIW